MDDHDSTAKSGRFDSATSTNRKKSALAALFFVVRPLLFRWRYWSVSSYAKRAASSRKTIAAAMAEIPAV
jgi:hypothetical protein